MSTLSLLYAPFYATLLVVCFTQSFYPIFMISAMLARQSRLLYSFFHKVEPKSARHGGELVARVLKAHGVENIFTLPGGHVSPIVVASDKLQIRVVDVRHEATAVFAADAAARIRGIPGVAVVTAGPGLTNTITAVKNAQLAESPVVVIAGAAATMLKGRGSLQDIDQLSLLQTAAKKCFSVDCVRDIVPTLREAFRVAQVDTPGPVLVELPVDILYPYSVISQQFASMSTAANESNSSNDNKPTDQQPTTPSPRKSPTGSLAALKARLIGAYANYRLKHIFADAWKEQDFDPLPVTIKQAPARQVRRVAELLRKAKRPLVIVGAQAVLKPFGPQSVAEHIKRLGVPVYLNGGARGLLGANYGLQFRHGRKQAVREADLVLLLGAVCDFRLSYGRIFKRPTKVVSVNRSSGSAKLNAGIFWQPEMVVEADVGRFVADLTATLLGPPEVQAPDSQPGPQHHSELGVDSQWLQQLAKREQERDAAIEAMADQPTDKYLNPLQLLSRARDLLGAPESILVADGGDFVASASYILKPGGPGCWLDPGPFGTLGCGAGFALAAKLLEPHKTVLAIMGDGAFGYALAELDTFVRHKLPVLWLIGNDACWTQIVREQVPMLGSPIGCQLAYTDYDRVAEGFGARGHKVDSSELLDEVLQQARADLAAGPVVLNALIGRTSFRDGSISV